jgi:hypothetical protein
MKRMILMAGGLLIAAASFSQVSLGVQVTGNLSSAKLEFPEGPDFTKKAVFGPGGGIVAQYAVNEKFALQSGVNFLQHGVKINSTEVQDGIGEIEIAAKTKLNYLQIPVYALYTNELSVAKIFIGAGPYANYGISGKSKYTYTLTDDNGDKLSESEETDAFKKDEDGATTFKRFDWGAAAIAGVRFPNGMFAHIGYQYSIGNISSDNESKYNNQGFQLSIGYFFH